jgi:hypothetical protein
MEPAKVYFINTHERCIEERTIASWEGIRELIDGSLEAAYIDPYHKNVLYVDEDGIRKHPHNVFAFALRSDQFLYGNGVWVGKEIEDDDGFHYDPPVISLDDLKTLVIFPAAFRRG